MIRAGALADGAGVESRGTMALERWESYRPGAMAPVHGEDDMPIIDHSHAPEVPWRPGYRRWDVAGHEQGVSSTLSINTAEPGTGAPLHTNMCFGGGDWKTLYFTSWDRLWSVRINIPGIPVPTPRPS